MANQIIVSEDRNQITVVEGETRIVEVVTQGPQGPIGPSGPAGPSGSSILNQITSGSVTASVDIGPTIFSIVSGSSTYLSLSSSGSLSINGDTTIQGNQFNAGTYWRAISGSNFSVAPWRGIAYGNGLFVAIADRSANGTSNTTSIATSPDGVTWTFRTIPSLTALTNIIYQNGIFVAVGRVGQRTFYSYDGINWFNGTGVNGIAFNVTYGKDKFVVCKIDNANNRIDISYDGKTWQGVSTPSTMDLSWTGLTYGNDRYVAVAESSVSGSIAISTDGLTWNNVTRPSAGVLTTYNVTYGKGLFVVTCNQGKIMTSPDGVTWTVRDTPLTGLIWKCIFADGVFIAAGCFSTTQNKFIYSVDGITWQEASTPALNDWGGFAYGNGLLLAVSYNGPNTGSLIVSSGIMNSFIAQNDNRTHGRQIFTDDLILSNSPISQSSGFKLDVSGPSRFIGNTTISGNSTITGSLTITGNITAQTLVVQTITSSVSFITGSTKFGSLSTNTHEFTGSVFVSGSVAFGGSTGLYWDNANNRLGIGTTTPSYNLHVYSNIGVQSSNFITTIGTGLGNVLTSGQTTNIGRYFALYADSADVNLTSGADTTGRMTLAPRGNSVVKVYGATGNVVIQNGGTFTDDTINRLQVVGSTFLSGSVTGSDMLIRGSGNTSATNAIMVQNSTNTGRFYFSNDRNFVITINDTGGPTHIFNSGGGSAQYTFNASTVIGTIRALFGSEVQFTDSLGGSASSTGLRLNSRQNLHLEGNSNIIFYTSGSLALMAERARITNSGSLLLGTSTDNGADRLQVSGSTLLRGSNNSPGTNSLVVQNNNGSSALSIDNGLAVTIHQDLYLGNTVILWNAGSQIRNTSNGVLRFSDSTGANFTRLQFGGTTSAFPGIQRVSGSLAIVGADGSTTSSLLIGQTTDDGVNRLQVSGSSRFIGNMVITGSITLSGNIGSTNINGNIQAGSSITFLSSEGIISTVANLSINVGPSSALTLNKTNNITATSGEVNWFYINPPVSRAFAPTSGTATMNGILINLPIVQSGGANGITRGLYITPSLTSAWDFRAIEWSNNASATSGSWGLYGAGSAPNFLSGSLGIGITSPQRPLHIYSNSGMWVQSPTGGNSVLVLTPNGIDTLNNSALTFSINGNNRMTLTNNLLIGLTSDDTVNRLQVSGSSRFLGNVLISGSGNTSGSNALTIQNSSNTNLFTVKNDGNVEIGSSTLASTITLPQTSGWTDFIITNNATANTGIRFRNTAGTRVITIGGTNMDLSVTNGTFNSGTATIGSLSISTISSTTIRGFNQATLDLNGDNLLLYSRTGTASPIRLLSGNASATSKGTVYVSDYSNLTGTINPSAQLQVDSTVQGFLPPRMTTTQKNAIATPAAGLVVYDTTLSKLCVYTTTWETITSS